MASWIRHAMRRGVVTSRYPRVDATDEELPMLGRPPLARPGSPVLEGLESRCPTKAIDAGSIDQGRCIRCARCLGPGIGSAPHPSASVGTRAALRWPDGRPRFRPADEAAPLRAIGRSIHVFLIDVGSCQGCNHEVLGITNPYYDAHRLGIFFTNSPRHADLLVVVGVPTPAMVEPLRRTFEAMPATKAVLAVGACSIDGGIFEGAPQRFARVDEIVPVDLYVAGCPPPPITVLEGILELAGRGGPPPRGVE